MVKVANFANGPDVAATAGGSGGGAVGSPAGGDLRGTIPNPTVTGLQGVPICTDTPATDDVLVFDGAQWCPAPLTSGGGIVLVTGAVSSPPTEAELESLIGAPVAGTTYLLTDSSNGYHYFVLSDGLAYQYIPLVMASGASPTTFSLTAAPEGGWSWFGDPRAVHYNGKTYFGYITGGGHPKATSYIHSSAIVTTPVDLYPAGVFQVDDHDYPSFLIRDSDKRIMAFFSVHGGPDVYMAVSTNTEDATTWNATANIKTLLGSGASYTYPSPVQLLGEASDPIYLFWRSATSAPGYWSYAKTTNGGTSWNSVLQLANFTYLKIVQNTDTRIDFAASNHPADSVDHGIYHFYYEGGNVYESDGTLIGVAGTTVVTSSNATQVYDGSSTIGWIWDIAIDSGDPRVAYTTFPSTTDHRYNYGTWSGSAWTTHQIAAGGTYIPTVPVLTNPLEVYYSGGVVLDHTDPNVAYCSIQSGSAWEIWNYTTANAGVTWTPTALTTSGSKNARPVSVRNYASDLKVMWWAGTYNSYVAYSVATMGSST